MLTLTLPLFIDDDTSQTCKRCGLAILEGHAYDIGGDRWHIECFACSKCAKLLGTQSNFLVLGNGDLVCSDCSYLCHACGKKIDDLAILTGNQAYCLSCFKCRACRKRIEDLRYARTSKGLFCMLCHEKLVARKRHRDRILLLLLLAKSDVSTPTKDLPTPPAVNKPKRRVPPQDYFGGSSVAPVDLRDDMGLIITAALELTLVLEMSASPNVATEAQLAPAAVATQQQPRRHVSQPLPSVSRLPLPTPPAVAPLPAVLPLSQLAPPQLPPPPTLPRAPPLPMAAINRQARVMDTSDHSFTIEYSKEARDVLLLDPGSAAAALLPQSVYATPAELTRLLHLTPRTPPRTGDRLPVQVISKEDYHLIFDGEIDADAYGGSKANVNALPRPPSSPHTAGLGILLELTPQEEFETETTTPKTTLRLQTLFRFGSGLAHRRNKLLVGLVESSTGLKLARGMLLLLPKLPRGLFRNPLHNRHESDLLVQMKRLVATITQPVYELLHLRLALELAQTDLRALNAEIFSLTQTKAGLKEELRGLGRERDVLAVEVARMRDTLESLSTMVLEIKQHLEQLTDERTLRRKELTELVSSIARAREEATQVLAPPVPAPSVPSADAVPVRMRPPPEHRREPLVSGSDGSDGSDKHVQDTPASSAALEPAEVPAADMDPRQPRGVARFWRRGKQPDLRAPGSGALLGVPGNALDTPELVGLRLLTLLLLMLLGNMLKALGTRDAVRLPPPELGLFGVPIEERVRFEGLRVPYIITRLMAVVEEVGLGEVGIYRVLGANSQIDKLERLFTQLLVASYGAESRGKAALETALLTEDIHAVPLVLKRYLRKLPEPLLTYTLYDRVIALARAGGGAINHGRMPAERRSAKIAECRGIVADLPQANRDTLHALVRHLHVVGLRFEQNKMGLKNLAVVFAPTLLWDPSGERELMDMGYRNESTEFLILHYQEVFRE